jgi:hypothetical protein
MKILQPAPDVFLKVAKVSNSFIELEEGISPMSQVQSGSWNPTATNVLGSPTINIVNGNYSRVGSVVTCSLFFEVTMGTGEASCTFDLDLPIASDFTQSKNAFGVVQYNDLEVGEFLSWGIAADTATNKIVMNFASASNEFSFQYLYAVLQYVII